MLEEQFQDIEDILGGIVPVRGVTDNYKWFKCVDGLYTVSLGYVDYNMRRNFLPQSDEYLDVMDIL